MGINVPPECQPLSNSISALERRRNALQDELRQAPPNQKGELIEQIHEINGEISMAHAALANCIAIHDPPQPVDPRLVVLDIEVVNSVQRRHNLVRLAPSRSAVVRVFVGSGITNGYDIGLGPGRWPDIRGRLRVVDADNEAELFVSAAPLNPGGTMVAQVVSDRNNAGHSLNFRVPGTSLLSRRIRFEAHVFVQGHEADGGGWVSDGAVTLEIPARRSPQLIQPVLIAETVSGDGVAPSMSTFMSTLQGAIDRFPIPEFTVAAPSSISTGRDLSTRAGWDGLLYDLHHWAGGASQEAGIIAGLVKFGNHANILGIGIQRQFFANKPKFVSEPRPATFAHEMAHSFGIYHARCTGTEGDYDDRLPPNGRSDEPGFNVTTGQFLAAGGSELMGYCFGADWPSVATYDIIYDNMPI